SREILYSLALKEGDTAARARWREELRRIEGQGGRTVALLDALHTAGSPAGDAAELVPVALAETPDAPEGHPLAARLAEPRPDAAPAPQQYELAADLDRAALKSQEARLGYYLRTGRDEDARRTLARLEADPRVHSLRFRAIVEGAVASAGPEALGKGLSWLQPQLKREP